MLILDTDHLSILDQDTGAAFNLGRRLAAVPPEDTKVSIITYEEQMRGWMSYIARAATPAQQVAAYEKLQQFIRQFRQILVVDYTLDAAMQFDGLRRSGVRIGAMDLKIAAICLANDATLLTRNLKDFGKVPGLRSEDWSA